jgi:2-iminobutanoate/2-iminopropanoate deaminase
MPTYPLSPFKKLGNFLFVSGQIGQQDGQLVSENLDEQITQTVKNIQAVLKQNGLDLIDIIDVTAFLIDQNDYLAFNEVYGRLFSKPYPTRTTVTVKSLPLNAKVELKVIAEIND